MGNWAPGRFVDLDTCRGSIAPPHCPIDLSTCLWYVVLYYHELRHPPPSHFNYLDDYDKNVIRNFKHLQKLRKKVNVFSGTYKLL